MKFKNQKIRKLLQLTMLLTVMCTTFAYSEAEGKSIKFTTIGASFWSACRGDVALEFILKSEKYKVKRVKSSACNPKGYYHVNLIKANDFEKLPKSSRTKKKHRNRIMNNFKKFQKNLKNNEFDYILFQAHSSWPFSDNYLKKADEYINYLKSLSGKSKIVACMTWIKQENRSQEKWNQIIKAYKTIEKKHNILMAPTGTAFMIANKERPDIKVYRTQKDGHPSVRGQYLNVCVIYSVITGKSPVGITSEIPTVSCSKTGEKMILKPEIATYLQNLAWRVVQAEKKGLNIKVNSNNKKEEVVYECKFNKQNKIIYKKEFINGKFEKNIYYNYENNLLNKEVVKDFSGQMILSKEYIYKNNNLQSITYKNNNNEITGYDIFEYKQGVLVSYKNFDKSKELTEKETYKYKNGNCKEKTFFSANGIECGSIKYQYKKGKVIEENEYKNNVQTKTTYVYNDKITEIKTIVDGIIIAKKIIKYDNKNQILLKEYYKKIDGKLTLIKNMTFKNKY